MAVEGWCLVISGVSLAIVEVLLGVCCASFGSSNVKSSCFWRVIHSSVTKEGQNYTFIGVWQVPMNVL